MAERMPDWPRCMQADLAARYCGVSRSTFLRGAGTRYPDGHLHGSNRIWYKEDLDRKLDLLKNRGAPSDPYLAAWGDGDGVDEREAR